MGIYHKTHSGVLALMAAGLCAVPVLAQQGTEEKPKPAARVLLPLGDLNGDQQDSDGNQTLEPDRGPVTGVQTGTLGTSQLKHSYWVTGAQYGNSAQSNSFSSTNGSGGWTLTHYASGNVSLLEAWGRSSIGANYTGGGSFSNDSGSSQYHQLSSAWELDERRWQALVIEQFSYLPQTSFGFGGTTGLSIPGISGALAVPLPGLQEQFIPGQAIFTVVGPRHSSATAAQVNYQVSRRGSLTVAAVYGLLRFSNSGNIGNDTEALAVAYGYAVTRKNSLGISYRFTAYHYPGNPQAMGDQLFQFMYARRITGRLALNIGGGPEVTSFRAPVNGSNQSISGGGGASLDYAFTKSSLRMSYSHGIGSGSGLFSGSRADQLTAYWSRPFGRAWSGVLNCGYARNTTIVKISGLSSPSYNSVSTGLGLNRPLSRSTRFAIGYQAQIQNSGGIVCAPTGCLTTQVGHQIQMSLQWNAPPQVLR